MGDDPQRAATSNPGDSGTAGSGGLLRPLPLLLIHGAMDGRERDAAQGFLRVEISERQLAASFVGSTGTSAFGDTFRVVADPDPGDAGR